MAKSKKEEIRVRIAPSPTGYLHVGTAHTALFNWFYAKHHSEGKFILRIEDTDLERSEKKYEDDIVAGLEWLGLKWDEFYKQSDRTKIYSKYIQQLLDNGKAFWCYHSEEELEAERREQMAKKGVPAHWCSYKSQISPASPRLSRGRANFKSQNLGKGIIRLAVNKDSTRKIKFTDIIRGEIEFEERLLGDVSIAKAVDVPLYHFAVVVDDYEMDITHVIRGEDHIANTPKQILLQEALGFEQPQYAHLPLILGADRSKLSKRHAATSIAEYRELGYLPEALVNFLALLGWTPNEAARARSGPLPRTGWASEETGSDVLTKNYIIEKFSLEKIHKSGAIFDIKKLNWLNSQYIKMENDEGLVGLVTPFIEKYFGLQDKEAIVKIAPLLRERLEYLDQVKEFHFFFKEPEYNPELLRWKSRTVEEVKDALVGVKEIIEKNGVGDKLKLRQELDVLGKKLEDRGLAYWPFRVALTGEKTSPDPIDIAYILGKEKTLERIKLATEKI